MIKLRRCAHRFHKLNVGDKVRVTKSIHGHNFEIGEIVEVLSSSNQGTPRESFYCGVDSGSVNGWYLSYEEMEKT